MQCRRARKQLSNERYGSPLSAATREHVHACAACQAFRRQSEQLDQVLDLDSELQAPTPGFDTRFFARLKEEKARPARKLRGGLRWAFIGFAVAAAAAIALVVAIPMHSPERMSQAEVMLVKHLDLLQEDVEMLRRLEEVEAYELLAQLDPEEIEELLQ